MVRFAMMLCAVIMVAVLCYGRWIEPQWLAVNHLQINSKQLNQVLAGRKAVHLTDLHLEGQDVMTAKILQLLAQIEPDLIFLTGDYVTWNGNYRPALDFLSQLEAEYGVWAVMGDYDYSNGRQSCLFCHEPGSGKPSREHRVNFLRDATASLDIAGNRLQIAGIEWRKGDEDQQWPILDSTGAAIVLVHNPLAFSAMPPDYAALVLAGDTHGGQIVLPQWLWSILGYEKNFSYNQGWFQRGGSQMYVSRGVGTSHLQFRLGRRPEITVLHF